MNKQLMTILKKRYGLALLITSLCIILFYGYNGVSDVKRWHEMNAYFDSEEYIKDLQQLSEDDSPRYSGLSLSERQALDKKEGLSLFYQTNSYDEQGKLISVSDQPYFSAYFSENPILLIAVLAIAGFLMFFADLKTAFNEFLFSLGVSKRRIYFSKFALVSLPLLSSVLLAKIVFVGIITTGIPTEYVNIGIPTLVANVLASWTTCILYFSLSAFIGLVTGNMILGPLTVFGFCASLEFFITGVLNAWYYFTNATIDRYITNKFFVYTVNKESISTFPIILAIAISLFLFIFGSFLFPKLTLEKKGNYLLFDKLKVPVVIAMTLYVPMVLVFSSGVYFGEDVSSPIPSLLIYCILTALIGSYLVFRKEINEWVNLKRQLNRNSSISS
ncbi:ABC transporter permease [Enterococcus rotai]|uniref:ABC transporter permease n=1 Tax=Enterococcus rotai TaxID=118060 RepID=UPI0032B4FD4B